MNTKQKSPSVKGEKIDGRKIKKLFERTFQSWQQHENETKRTGNYYSNEQYGSEPDSGFTFKVSVVSDIPIPKNY